jgi:putative endonuclease
MTPTSKIVCGQMFIRRVIEVIAASYLYYMPRLTSYSVYILSNVHRTVFYIGVTSDLMGRVWQHKNDEGGQFTSCYQCHYLLYYEEYVHINRAIEREKNLKNWRREWKINLIKQENPEMKDLAADWYR